jgi:hypothetical protein
LPDLNQTPGFQSNLVLWQGAMEIGRQVVLPFALETPELTRNLKDRDITAELDYVLRDIEMSDMAPLARDADKIEPLSYDESVATRFRKYGRLGGWVSGTAACQA